MAFHASAPTAFLVTLSTDIARLTSCAEPIEPYSYRTSYSYSSEQIHSSVLIRTVFHLENHSSELFSLVTVYNTRHRWILTDWRRALLPLEAGGEHSIYWARGCQFLGNRLYVLAPVKWRVLQWRLWSYCSARGSHRDGKQNSNARMTWENENSNPRNINGSAVTGSNNRNC